MTQPVDEGGSTPAIPQSRVPRSPARLVLIVGWIVPALVASIGMVVVPSRLNPGLTLGEIVISQLAVWLPWAGWSLLVTTVADRVPLQRGGVAKAMACLLYTSPSPRD